MPGMCLCVLCSVHIRVRIAINPKFSEGFTSQPFQKRKLDGLSAVVPRSGRERGFHERAAQSGVSFPCPVSWITIPLKENPDDTSYTMVQWPILLPHDFVAGCCSSQTNFVFRGSIAKKCGYVTCSFMRSHLAAPGCNAAIRRIPVRAVF